MANVITEEIKNMGPWFHNLHLPGGEQTAPDHFLGDFPNFKWKELAPHIPEDLSGYRALDIGCNAGYYSFELARRGASVLGIDLDPHYLIQAKWAAKQYGLEDKVRFEQMQVYDILQLDEKFDMVWFMGVFYHLRYPLLALDIISQKLNGLLVFQTLMMPDRDEKQILDDYGIHEREEMLDRGWPKMAFIENKLAGDITNWWAPNHGAVMAMVRSCGFKVTNMPLDETYICEKDQNCPSVIDEWDKSEFLSAIGRHWQQEWHSKVKK